MRFRRLCNCDLAILSVSPACALNSVTHHHHRVLRRLRRRKMLALGGRLRVPLLPRHVTIVSSTATTNCKSFYRRLRRGSHNFFFCARLFPTVVRNGRMRRSILSTLSHIGTQLNSFSIIIVVHNKKTASSLSNFSACLLTTTYTRFPLPVVANVKRRHSSAILSSITRAQIGAPATTTRLLVGHVSRTTSRLRCLSAHLHRNTSTFLRHRSKELLSYRTHVPTLIIRQLSSTHFHLLATDGSLVRISTTLLTHRHRHLRLFRRHVASTSPSGLLTHNCDVALGRNGPIASTSRMSPNSRVVAHLRRKRLASVMGSRLLRSSGYGSSGHGWGCIYGGEGLFSNCKTPKGSYSSS